MAAEVDPGYLAVEAKLPMDSVCTIVRVPEEPECADCGLVTLSKDDLGFVAAILLSEPTNTGLVSMRPSRGLMLFWLISALDRRRLGGDR